MSNQVGKRLKSLRAEMEKHGVDAYVVPSADLHQSEYVAEHWKCRAWISGFTGSAGAVAVMSSSAGLWTDGRYFIQAAQELAGSGIDLFKMQMPGVPELVDWLFDNVPEGGRVGVDGRLITTSMAEKWKRTFRAKKIRLVTHLDLISGLWLDRPALSVQPAKVHPMEYAGRTVADKLKEIREAMVEKKAELYLLSSLYDIAWLFNLRGSDVPMCPVLTAYALVEKERAVLFVDESKLTEEVRSVLEADGVEWAPYDAIWSTLKALPKERSLYLCDERVSAGLHASVACKVVTGKELTALPKARKNETELKNWSRVQELDGAAMVRFWKWLEEAVLKGGVTECSASNQLAQFRLTNSECVDLSFSSISAYGANGAMMHYSPKPETCAALQPHGFYLIDSGGQYLGGTTDITRTFALGELTDEQRTDYTLVLKGVISLTRARFLKGSAGNNLDVLARQPLWEHGLDYKCGTGHGVGYYLNVHEGPQNFSQHKRSDTPLEPGMILTIEPGVYKEGRHGIRTENMVVVEEDCETECGTFYRFRTLTLCPIDIAPLHLERLSPVEIEWLNAYHQTVRKRLNPHLTAGENAWLETKTQPISASFGG
ncbi:MAG: aminopeptidase P family protein [Lentisphaerae bacterium]|nr:aminopeptidase P family protein [Lentisphaerota bacterium]